MLNTNQFIMSENTNTPQEAAKQTFTSGLDRLSSDSLFNDVPEIKKDGLEEVVGGSTLPNVPVTEATEKPLEETLKSEAKDLGLSETATKEEIEAAQAGPDCIQGISYRDWETDRKSVV